MNTADGVAGNKNINGKQQMIPSLRLYRFVSLREKLRVIFLTVMTCFSFLLSDAQAVLKTSVDKNEILIGDQFTLTIEASSLPEGYKITWPVIPDSLAHFEVISRGKMDSLYNDNRLSGLVQTVVFTSFDSGKWVLPSFMVNMIPEKVDSTYSFFTDSVPVTVSFSVSDTTSQLKDIKPIREVAIISQWWYWAGAAVLLVALVIFSIWLYRRGKKKKPTMRFQSKNSPFDEAMKELENLKAYNLSIPGDIKMVHTRLGEILKHYLSRRENNDFLNKTTGDILIWLSDHNGNVHLLTKAAASLRCGDAVKFAKYLPPADESGVCLQSMKEVIQNINGQSLTTNHQLSTINPTH